MTTSQRDLERIAAEYDSLTDFDRHAIEYEADLFLARYRGGAVLELGCAGGGMTRKLAPVVERLVVVEGAKTYADALRAELGERIELVHASFDVYTPERPFRHVLAARILEHLDDPVGFLRRARSWLEPAGTLHVIVPNARSMHRLLGVEMGLISDVHELGERDHRVGHVRVYDSDLLAADIEAAGYFVERREDVLLKPLSNAQMESWDPAVVRALFGLVRHFPDHGNELYFRCRPTRVPA